MRIRRSGPFLRDFRELPLSIQRRTDKVLQLLASNFSHPSLRARITDKKRRLWKVNIDGGYRLTFQIEEKTIVLRRIGAHGEMERSDRW